MHINFSGNARKMTGKEVHPSPLVELEWAQAQAYKPGLIARGTLHRPEAWWAPGRICSKAWLKGLLLIKL